MPDFAVEMLHDIALYKFNADIWPCFRWFGVQPFVANLAQATFFWSDLADFSPTSAIFQLEDCDEAGLGLSSFE